MQPLTNRIASLQRRMVLQRRAVAACRIAATVLAAGIALGAIDYWLRVSDAGLRIMATSTLAAVAAWAVYRWWYLPGCHRLTPLAVARRIEAHFPQLCDSLASAVEFLEQSAEDSKAGSAQLRRLVVTAAQSAAASMPLEEIIDWRPLRRAGGWLAAAMAALAVCIAWDTSAVGTALVRLVAPLGTSEWPREHRLEFRNAPTQLAVGQTFEAELVDTAGPLPDDVRVEYRFAMSGGHRSISEPISGAGDTLVVRREDVRQPFAFRATGGDDHTMRWHSVQVVEPPRLESLSITVHPPAYTGLAAQPAERHLDVLAGTGIEVSGAASEPLRSARIRLENAPPIAASIVSDSAGREARGFHVLPVQWIASASGPYRIELTNADGIAGVVGPWNLRVEPDSPPSVSWRRPGGDLYVVATAVVPIELVVADNLAIQRVSLVYERSDRPASQADGEPIEQSIELYHGPEKPVPESRAAAGTLGENRGVQFVWDLAPLQLPVGTHVTLHAEAADYRPGVGRTAGPRQITVIAGEELAARLADRQAQIVRQLERALAVQRTTREGVRRLEIGLSGTDTLAATDRNALQAAELNQRRVGRTLVDPVEGVPAQVDALVSEIEINRVPASELRASMEQLTHALERLSSDPLDVAERELVAARKSIAGTAHETNTPSDTPLAMDPAVARRLADSLAATGAAQDDVVLTLQQLIDDLAGRVDYRRLAQQLAELRQDQLAHEQSARTEIGLETLPLQLSELSRGQRAELNKAAAGQSAIAARYQRAEQQMDELARRLTESDADAVDALSQAADLARRLAIASAMQETARDFEQNRVGQALARETQIAANLQQVLDLLGNPGERQPERLVSALRAAEQPLSELRERLAALRQQIAGMEQPDATAASAQQPEQLKQQQQELARDIEQLSAQLDRLQAVAASQSARSAASRLAKPSSQEGERTSRSQRPSPSGDVRKAEQDLEQAARQLAERRKQAEEDLALALVRRCQAELGQMVERQQRLIKATVALDSQRPPTGDLSQAANQIIVTLAGEEHQLADLAGEHGQVLSGLGAVRTGFAQAERLLAAAAQSLEAQNTGANAQAAEKSALARLESMLEAFAQTASEAGQNQPPSTGPGGAADPPPPPRPTFQLLEVKMLRMLQVDLNAGTRSHKERLAGAAGPMSEQQRAELARESQELQAEQSRLAELVQEMLSRDNEPNNQ